MKKQSISAKSKGQRKRYKPKSGRSWRNSKARPCQKGTTKVKLTLFQKLQIRKMLQPLDIRTQTPTTEQVESVAAHLGLKYFKVFKFLYDERCRHTNERL